MEIAISNFDMTTYLYQTTTTTSEEQAGKNCCVLCIYTKPQHSVMSAKLMPHCCVLCIYTKPQLSNAIQMRPVIVVYYVFIPNHNHAKLLIHSPLLLCTMYLYQTTT